MDEANPVADAAAVQLAVTVGLGFHADACGVSAGSAGVGPGLAAVIAVLPLIGISAVDLAGEDNGLAHRSGDILGICQHDRAQANGQLGRLGVDGGAAVIGDGAAVQVAVTGLGDIHHEGIGGGAAGAGSGPDSAAVGAVLPLVDQAVADGLDKVGSHAACQAASVDGLCGDLGSGGTLGHGCRLGLGLEVNAAGDHALVLVAGAVSIQTDGQGVGVVAVGPALCPGLAAVLGEVPAVGQVHALSLHGEAHQLIDLALVTCGLVDDDDLGGTQGQGCSSSPLGAAVGIGNLAAEHSAGVILTQNDLQLGYCYNEMIDVSGIKLSTPDKSDK